MKAKHRDGSERVELEGITLGKETAKAIMITTAEGEDIWIPISQVHQIVRTKEKGADRLVVSKWIAEQKGLI